jgi:hypothetical protein
MESPVGNAALTAAELVYANDLLVDNIYAYLADEPPIMNFTEWGQYAVRSCAILHKAGYARAAKHFYKEVPERMIRRMIKANHDPVRLNNVQRLLTCAADSISNLLYSNVYNILSIRSSR